MTTADMVKTVRARYRKSKNAGLRTNFQGIMMEVVKENGFKGDEISTKMSELAQAYSSQRTRFVRSWRRKAS